MIRSGPFAVALVLAALCPAAAGAQTLPFRTGQWGAEFQSGDLTTAGVMRFFSPRSALVLDAGVLDLGLDEDDKVNSTTDESSLSLWAARLGLRSYMPVANRVAGFWTAGVELARSSQKQTIPGFAGPQRIEESETHLGAFGQLGADYHVTNNLAVGMAFDVVFARVSGERTGPNTNVDLSGHRFTAAFTPVRVSLFF